MSITYLIGNGFDIGLGLDTRYVDFIDSYVPRVNRSDQTLATFVEAIEKDRETWSDAELAFGGLPFSEFGSDDVEESFCRCYRDFQKALRSYLKKQQNRLQLSQVTAELKAEFRNSLIRLVKYVGGRNRSTYLRLLDAQENAVAINCINFNYTTAFDSLVGVADDAEAKLFSYKDEDTHREGSFYINKCVHVHGSLDGGRLLFGVNDVNQIVDRRFAGLSGADGYLIKSQMASEGSCSFYNEARELLKNSDVVVLFGLSYGATDKRWWDDIVGLVQDPFQHPYFRSILCPYEMHPIEAVEIPDEIRISKKEVRKFLRNTDLDEGSYSGQWIRERLVSLLHGPYNDIENSKDKFYCDPLHLNYFGRKCVKDFNREPIRYEE